MDAQLGHHKAAHWRNSALLPSRGDRVTGSKDRYHLEYGCPEDWEQYSEEELREQGYAKIISLAPEVL